MKTALMWWFWGMAMGWPLQGGVLTLPEASRVQWPMEMELLLHQGRTSDFEALLRGKKVAILAPIYTSCPVACPTLAKLLRESYLRMDHHERENVQVILLSFAEDDGIGDLAGFFYRNDLPGEWVVAKGEETPVRAFLAELDYLYTKSGPRDYVHSASYSVIDGSGRVVGFGAGSFAGEELRAFLREEGWSAAWKNPALMAAWGGAGFVLSGLWLVFGRKERDAEGF
ncbi:MAG: hypothetical protein AAF191_06155 [Verrucomicrobiota bacterium]